MALAGANSHRVRSDEEDSTATSLPDGFGELERFVAYWSLDTNDQRRRARSDAAMEDIRFFYDAIYARAEDAMAFLDAYSLDGLPPKASRLFKLLLAMNHAAVAVEMHGQPRAHNSRHPSPVRVTRGPQPFGGDATPRNDGGKP